MRSCFAPGFRFARRLDGVANVLAVAKRRFPKQTPVRATHFDAVTRIGPRLFAADVELHGAVDRGSREIVALLRRLIHRERRWMNRWRVLKPCRLEIFEQPLAPTLASITALAITPETAGGVEKICAVNPNYAGFELRRNVQGNIDAFAPHAGSQAVNRIVGEFHSFSRSAERHRGEYRAENLLLRHHGSRMNVAQQRRRKIQPSRWYGNGGLPAGRSFRDALVDQPLYALELHARDDGANVDGFIERRADPQRVHAVLNLADQFVRDALLHQQPRTGAANLPLVEPDAVNQSFHGAIQIGVFKNDERRLTAKFEGKLLVALGGSL